MTYDPLASTPLGGAIEADPDAASLAVVQRTILSQYANSPVILEIIRRWALAFQQDSNIEMFYAYVWNVRTAKGYGLDVLGRIVGVNRVLRIPATPPYIGWASDAYNWGSGIWYGLGNLTQNYALSDDVFRRLVLAKAALNICNGSIPEINRILMMLFPDRGNCYVQDNGSMAITYVFGGNLTPVDYAIISQSGVLPKPVGVSVSAQVNA
jgi:hypothetical protein